MRIDRTRSAKLKGFKVCELSTNGAMHVGKGDFLPTWMKMRPSRRNDDSLGSIFFEEFCW